MSHQRNTHDEVLARWVREAGDPSVAPDPEYEEKLRAAILDRIGAPETSANLKAGLGKTKAYSVSVKRTHQVRRLVKLAVAAVVLLAVGFFIRSFTGGGSSNLAFGEVAEALDHLRTATYDCTVKMKNPIDGTTTTTNMKGYFLAPSRERIEVSVSVGAAKDQVRSIIILDHQAMKGLTLAPDQKLATTIDLSKTKKPSGPSNPFELVRQLVREARGSSAERVKSLGRTELDGRPVVGFRVQTNLADQTLWADPETARLVRIELEFSGGAGQGVMRNFRYDVDLDPSLFSLQPPAGYTVNVMNVEMPTEDDLVNLLRLIAEHNDGVFPPAIGMGSKEYQKAIQAASQAATEEFLKRPETQELRENLKAQHGKDKDGFTKAWMNVMVLRNQELTLKYTQGIMFYNLLTLANDSHYAGGGVKLGTPDRPIFWYRPTGADKYRVIHADLSVRQMTGDEVKQLPVAGAK